jgi:excisionase family DNA binding protein
MSRRRITVNTPTGQSSVNRNAAKPPTVVDRTPNTAVEVKPHAHADPSRLALSIAETAVALGVSKRHVEKLVATGELPSRTFGRRRLVSVTALEKLLEGQQ